MVVSVVVVAGRIGLGGGKGESRGGVGGGGYPMQEGGNGTGREDGTGMKAGCNT